MAPIRGSKQLTKDERQRVRTLWYDARFTKLKIQEITGYTRSQVRNAIIAESAALKPRSGRPPKREPKEPVETIEIDDDDDDSAVYVEESTPQREVFDSGVRNNQRVPCPPVYINPVDYIWNRMKGHIQHKISLEANPSNQKLNQHIKDTLNEAPDGFFKLIFEHTGRPPSNR